MIKRSKVTIIDVAKIAGVSTQTVSRVLNDKPDVAEITRENVKSVIKKLGYHPDPIARSMRGKACMVGCITPTLSDYSFSSIIQAAQAEAQDNGYFLLAGSATTEYDVIPLLNEMLHRRIDGILVINPRDDGRYRHFLSLIEQGIPVVYLKNSPIGEKVSAVCLDDESGGYLATQHLLELGHSKIATIQGPLNEECVRNRSLGYRKAIQEAKKEINPDLILHGDWTAGSGYLSTKNLIEKNTQFSAIFAQNDQMAVGAMHAVHDAGMQIPCDISVIGYDDIPLSSHFEPPLTTIHQPMDQFGQIGMELLIEEITEKRSEPRFVLLEPKLIKRESCSSKLSLKN